MCFHFNQEQVELKGENRSEMGEDGFEELARRAKTVGERLFNGY